MQGGGLVCSSGCREVERRHRLGEEERLYRRLVDQINSIVAVFTPRMAAAGNPGATHLGQPEIKRRSKLLGGGTTETEVLRGPLGWRVASVGTGDDPDSPGSVQLASVGLDVQGRLFDLTHPAHDPPAWELGARNAPNGPPREYDDYDYRYIAEREIPRSLHELLLSHTGTGLTDDMTRCYYCGHAGFHQLSPIGALWSLDENWPRTCRDCIECWVGP
ncbi:MAG: hypothetical protein QOF77_992 [Solirubrobacteraceae bacterium]|jgi:hypothetical protein|nr:hypothetical protein [Solirubrobacteraceae bacterium]